MPDESKLQLITAVRDFALHGTRYPLRGFQCIAGHLNSALNVYPHLWPDLCALYAKTADKLFQKALLWVNRGVVERELTWVADHLLRSDGIYFLRYVSWSYDDLSPSVLHVYCNASPFAMVFWYPSFAQGFQVPAHQTFTQQGGSIFYLEALCVCAAILDAAPCLLPDQGLAVHTDNINTVQLFNSLSALPAFNWMLIQVVDRVMSQGIDLRVFHVPGVHNEIADAVSRLQNDLLAALHPELVISAFQPP